MQKGTITKLTQYKPGKGAFIGIDNAKPDFMFFGAINFKEGDSVLYEEGRPSKDGKPTIKSISKDTIEAFEARDEDRAKPTQIPYRNHDAPKVDAKDEYWLNRGKQDLIKDATITRLSCISSAVNAKTTENLEGVIAMAKRFELFATKGE
jgi:hypothetical protein